MQGRGRPRRHPRRRAAGPGIHAVSASVPETTASTPFDPAALREHRAVAAVVAPDEADALLLPDPVGDAEDIVGKRLIFCREATPSPQSCSVPATARPAAPAMSIDDPVRRQARRAAHHQFALRNQAMRRLLRRFSIRSRMAATARSTMRSTGWANVVRSKLRQAAAPTSSKPMSDRSFGMPKPNS